MRKLAVFISLITLVGIAYGQNEKGRDDSSGDFELGLRSTASIFSQSGYPGTGVGGQFRLRIADRLNTEWFADYITTDLEGLGKRVDGHVGWAVMFYPMNTLNEPLSPYIMAGHCFDYTKVTPSNPYNVAGKDLSEEKWSSAVHVGLGNHFRLTRTVDLSLSALYMTHLGKDIHTEVEEEEGQKILHVEPQNDGAVLEGHVLITASINVKVADLWK